MLVGRVTGLYIPSYRGYNPIYNWWVGAHLAGATKWDSFLWEFWSKLDVGNSWKWIAWCLVRFRMPIDWLFFLLVDDFFVWHPEIHMFGWIIGHKTLASFKDNEEKDDIFVYFSYTPPKFNIAPENNGWKITFLLGWLIFMGYVCILNRFQHPTSPKNCRVFPLTHSQRPAARENTSLQQFPKFCKHKVWSFHPSKRPYYLWWIHGTGIFTYINGWFFMGSISRYIY